MNSVAEQSVQQNNASLYFWFFTQFAGKDYLSCAE